MKKVSKQTQFWHDWWELMKSKNFPHKLSCFKTVVMRGGKRERERLQSNTSGDVECCDDDGSWKWMKSKEPLASIAYEISILACWWWRKKSSTSKCFYWDLMRQFTTCWRTFTFLQLYQLLLHIICVQLLTYHIHKLQSHMTHNDKLM